MLKYLKSLFYLFVFYFFFNFSSNLLATEIKAQEKLYGITIDDGWYDDVNIGIEGNPFIIRFKIFELLLLY